MRKNKKRALALSVLASFCLASSITSLASEGWVLDGENWRYQTSAGKAVSDKWIESGNQKYYLGGDGIMLADSLTEIDNRYYYFDESGVMVSSQWLLLSDDEGSHWYYFGSDGKAYRKGGNSFLRNINGKKYAFDGDGRMLTGWLNEDGDQVEEGDTPFIDALYYCGEDGALYQEQWLKFVDGKEHDLESLTAGRIYGEYDEIWLHFDRNGKKVKGSGTESAVERTIAGKTYGFDENGVMIPWWGPVATKSNAVKYYSGYDGGHLLSDTWIWMYPSQLMDDAARYTSTDYLDEEASWFRIGSNGQVLRNRIMTVNGEKYAFDDIGRMQTGFVLFNGTKDFVGEYEVDAFESRDFIHWDGDGIIGIENADLYLFSANELNDGAMVTGKDIKVELSDGTFTFGFGSNGKAYGNRNELQRKNDRFYINGLRLDGDENLRYGVVAAADKDGNEVYYVVDTKGAVQKGNKALKGEEDHWFIIVNGEFKAYVAADKPRWHKGPEGTGFYYYDKDNKDDKYAGGMIADGTTIPTTAGLPGEGRLNFY